MTVALLQFADRNPALTEDQHTMLFNLATQLIDAIAEQEPVIRKYLEMGWDPLLDQPIKREGEK